MTLTETIDALRRHEAALADMSQTLDTARREALDYALSLVRAEIATAERCPACHGTGDYVDAWRDEACGPCNGTGKRKEGER